MNTTIKNLVWVTMLFSAIILGNSCNKDDGTTETVEYVSIIDVAEDGVTDVSEAELKTVLAETPDLETSEVDILLKMKDDEKLAMDVYNALYEKWNVLIFDRIANAEEKHLNAVMLLLEGYEVEGATEIAAQGEFEDSAIQNLYNDLIVKGSNLLEDAYTVGALIEELDIKDLQDALAEVGNENIVLVFENLLKGSRNHLRAFNIQLVGLGITYVPEYIDHATFEDIINSPMEKGKQYMVQKGNGNGNGQGQAKGNRWQKQSGDGSGTCQN